MTLAPEAPAGRPSPSSSLRHDPLTRGLGLASAALGVPQLTRPGGFARGLGIDDAPRHRAVTELVGVRELAAAAGLLGRPHPAWLWGRVGGDAMDISLVARALRNHDGRGLTRTALAMAGLVVITAVDLYAAVTRTARRERTTPMELTSTTTVTRPAEDVYDFWRRLDRLPSFMAHVEEVRITGDRTSHWKATAPFGVDAEWDARTTEDVPGRRIAWRSVDGADVPNSGEVRFEPAPGGRGTEVHVHLTFDMPAGELGRAIARYFGEDPSQQLDDDLRRFKQVVETGEVVRSDVEMAAAQGYETIDYSDTDVRSALLELTGGRGPDKCIDAVGLEATHGAAHVQLYDRVKQAVRSESDRPHALRQAILSCRSGGIVSVIGVYGGLIDKFPAGAWMNRALTLKTGQCHVQRYMRPLLGRIERGEIDPTRVITHRLPLGETPHGYDIFKHKDDRCEKVVLKP